jgi:hypothetical protein
MRDMVKLETWLWIARPDFSGVFVAWYGQLGLVRNPPT